MRYLHCTMIFLIRNSHFDLYYLYSNTIRSVRKVVEKYNGTIIFTDKGMSFEASAILYGIEDEE